MKMTVAASLCAVVVGTVTGGVSIAWQMPDAGVAGPPGGQVETAVLSGVVLSDEASARPVRRATVHLTGEILDSARLAGTDDDGRFRFDGLPSGSFTLSATKLGYVAAFHGSPRPGQGPGVPVKVGTGEHTDVVLRMLHGAVISGRVVDGYGRPAPNVPVLAVEFSGRRSMAQPQRASTDDRGEYRIFGLAPGEYLVAARPALQPTAPGRGRIGGEVLTTSDDQLRWALALGRGAVAAGAPPAPPAAAYTPVYYPGTTDPAAAAPVAVGAGAEVSGIGMALQLVPLAKIAGRLFDIAGEPVRLATVSLYPRRAERPSPGDRLVAAGVLILPRAVNNPPDFSIDGVPPGEYTIVARSGSAMRRATMEEAGNERHWAVADVSITGSNQTDLVLRLLPGAKVAGSAAFEGSPTGWPTESLEVVLSLTSAQLGGALTSNTALKPDATFLFPSVPPGSYTLHATLPSTMALEGWTLKSAILDGDDISDSPLLVEPGASGLGGMEVTFTDRAAEVSGRLIDDGGQPVTRLSIVVVTTDRSLWLPNARRVRAVAPATDGSFRLRGLPAGEYALAAVRNLHEADLADPAFLTRIVEAGYTIMLDWGADVQQDLRIGGGVRPMLGRLGAIR